MAASLTIGSAEIGPGYAGSRWESPAPVRYPDPNIKVLDPRFQKYVLGNAAIERIAGGCRFTEGPAWFGDGRYLLWSDIPNDRILKWEEETGAVSRGNYLGNKAPQELPFRVYRIDPATGQMTIAVGDMKRPNGLAFSPDEKLLYVIDTPGPGQRTIQVYDVIDNVKTANRR